MCSAQGIASRKFEANQHRIILCVCSVHPTPAAHLACPVHRLKEAPGGKGCGGNRGMGPVGPVSKRSGMCSECSRWDTNICWFCWLSCSSLPMFCGTERRHRPPTLHLASPPITAGSDNRKAGGGHPRNEERESKHGRSDGRSDDRGADRCGGRSNRRCARSCCCAIACAHCALCSPLLVLVPVLMPVPCWCYCWQRGSFWAGPLPPCNKALTSRGRCCRHPQTGASRR
jgi:hypothetical protein